MAVSSANAEKIESMDQFPSTRVSDAASDSSSADPSENSTSDHPNSSPSTLVEIQPSLRSEEYRQLFRLPLEEVLIQDFNCAFQENFLLQGHMYLFLHYICFYSNLFGYETKKIIHFQEVTSVKRAKTAAIFPTAIEIIAAGKKYLFTSFLSRDEAFKLINDGWLEHGNGTKAIMDQQEARTELNSQETGLAIVEQLKSSKEPVDELDIPERNKDDVMPDDSESSPNGEVETVLASSEVQDNVEEDVDVVLVTDCSSSGKSLVEELEDSDAPAVPEYFTMVAEAKFPIKVEEFFNLFFSDNAVDFLESFHKKCGDKDFKCSPWSPHERFGHARDVSFQHPIKIYFGARFGSCQEAQKYKLYRNSHLVVDTSQEIDDVPYGDYFRVEGLWNVEKDGDESRERCNLRVYTNVAFSKKTMWKGKIVQSTVEECREAYAIWIDLAHEFLKQKNLENEAGSHEANLITNDQGPPEMQATNVEGSERSNEESDLRMSETLPESRVINQVSNHPLRGSLGSAASVASCFRHSMEKLCLHLKSQSQLPSLVVIIVAVIFLLMQISIIVLLARPQHIQMIPQADCIGSIHSRASEIEAETMALVDKQIDHLKQEMLMVETLLHKMQHEHDLLKVQLKDLMLLRKKHVY